MILFTTQMPTEPVTVLLDTNVFLAAYWNPGSASARVIRACIEGRVRAVYTEPVQREAQRMLRQVKVSQDYLEWLEEFWERAAKVDPVAVDDVAIDDPDDRKFLEAAAGGEVDFLATNDDHLLRIGYLGRTEILTPGSLARLLGL